MTETEAQAEGFELDDYETEIVEIWPDNELAYQLFQRIGTRWRHPPMGGAPIGFDWQAIYPLMDRFAKDDSEWRGLLDDLTILEAESIAVIKEFMPKPEET